MSSEVRLENFWIWTLKKQHIKEIICRAKRGKKIMEKLNRAQKCSILGPQNLGSRGGPGPRGPPWIRTCRIFKFIPIQWFIRFPDFTEFSEFLFPVRENSIVINSGGYHLQSSLLLSNIGRNIKQCGKGWLINGLQYCALLV